MTTKWEDLSPRTQRFILISASFEMVLKVAALADLARRPAEQVRGSKARWAAAILFSNSLGAVPIVYFRNGRRT